jgi:hypothetical protein
LFALFLIFFYWSFSSNFPLIIWFHLNFISNIILILFIDVFFSNWILLLICPLTFDFKLILHQIYFFIAILNLFIAIFFLILPPNILLIYNLTSLFSRVCFLQDWIPDSYLEPWVLKVDMGWTLFFIQVFFFYFFFNFII